MQKEWLMKLRLQHMTGILMNRKWQQPLQMVWKFQIILMVLVVDGFGPAQVGHGMVTQVLVV